MDFSAEPPHSSSLIVRQDQPFNAEPDVAKLIEHPITPAHLAYVRNHGPVKPFNAESFTLDVNSTATLSMQDIRALPKTEVVAALQCAGNRRATIASATGKDVEGLPWHDAAVANARWAGASLRDVLARAGIAVPDNHEGHHIVFAARRAGACEHAPHYEVSVPLAKALDALLAYDMNGAPLAPAHGFPLRAVVPGVSGVRWCKWVDSVRLADSESAGFYQQHDYKVLPPQVTSRAQADAGGWWARAPPLQENAPNVVIASACAQAQGSVLAVRGYALDGTAPGGVQRVQASADRGASWVDARITYREGRWSWALWSAELVVREGKGVVWARVVDEQGRCAQEEPGRAEWNLRGVGWNAYAEFEW